MIWIEWKHFIDNFFFRYAHKIHIIWCSDRRCVEVEINSLRQMGVLGIKKYLVEFQMYEKVVGNLQSTQTRLVQTFNNHRKKSQNRINRTFINLHTSNFKFNKFRKERKPAAKRNFPLQSTQRSLFMNTKANLHSKRLTQWVLIAIPLY